MLGRRGISTVLEPEEDLEMRLDAMKAFVDHVPRVVYDLYPPHPKD